MGKSENKIENYTIKKIKNIGGLCIKLHPLTVRGLPDRLCLLPKGICFFAELKSPGKTPGKSQILVHKKLRSLGFKVYVPDSIERVDEMISYYETEI